MATGIPDLWPESLDVDVLSPMAILRRQGDALANRTKGIVSGQVESVSSEDKTQLNFDLIATAMGDFTFRLLTITHDKEMVYPAHLKASFNVFVYDYGDPSVARSCADDKELMEALGIVFTAPETSSVLASLIARSNDETKHE